VAAVKESGAPDVLAIEDSPRWQAGRLTPPENQGARCFLIPRVDIGDCGRREKEGGAGILRIRRMKSGVYLRHIKTCLDHIKKKKGILREGLKTIRYNGPRVERNDILKTSVTGGRKGGSKARTSMGRRSENNEEEKRGKS